MKVCIAGGGKVGMYLAQSLLAHRHKVTIIEPQEMLCRSLADSLDIPVICGDAISFDTMRTADVASCDAFVAVTGADENNLVACQIAKREFGVNRTVARASNPKNRELLHTLGVDTVVCGTDNLSHILEREIETDTIRQLLSLGGGTASLNEILLPENFQFAGQAVKDIPMPGDVILVCITRDAEFIIPHGNTTLLPWDRILCLTQDDTLHLLMDAWGLPEMTERDLLRTALIIPPKGRAVLCVWAAVPGVFCAPFVFWQSLFAGCIFCALWACLVFAAWARACSFTAVLTARNTAVRAGIAVPITRQLPRRAVTGVWTLRTPLLWLAGCSVLVVHGPGVQLFLPGVDALQAQALAAVLMEETP